MKPVIIERNGAILVKKGVLNKMAYPTRPMPFLSLRKKCKYCKKLSITPAVTVQFP